jgi:hypothetical protein
MTVIKTLHDFIFKNLYIKNLYIALIINWKQQEPYDACPER